MMKDQNGNSQNNQVVDQNNEMLLPQDQNSNKTHKLSIAGASLAVISTLIGGGIVSLPHSIYFTGLILGSFLVFIAGAQTAYSCYLYLLAKDYLPGKPMSMFEIGFILFNRSSIFFISAIIIFNSLGLIIIYFIVFGDTLKSLIHDFSSESDNDFFGKRMAYVIILSVILVPIILKKELKEIKMLSVLLFTTLFGFVVLIIVQMSRLGIQKFNKDFQEPNEPTFFYKDYYEPKWHDKKLLGSVSVILVSFGGQFNLFPLYSELKTQTNIAATKSFGYACLTVAIFYIFISMICLYSFGGDVGEKYPTILLNLGSECKIKSECPIESKVLRIMFLIVLACHIPFIFFSGKEGLLIIIDEIDRKSISKALEFKIQNLEFFDKNNQHELDESLPEYQEQRKKIENLLDLNSSQAKSVEQNNQNFQGPKQNKEINFDKKLSGTMQIQRFNKNKLEIEESQNEQQIQQSKFKTQGLVGYKKLNEEDAQENMYATFGYMPVQKEHTKLKELIILTQKIQAFKNTQEIKAYKKNQTESEEEIEEKKEEESGKTYSDMKPLFYFSSTLLLFSLEATLAILIEDVSTVFDFLAAIAVTCLGFAFPAAFFIYAEKKYPNQQMMKSNWLHRYMAYLHVFLAIFVFGLSMTSNIISLFFS